MSKTRLAFLLIALSLTVLALLAAPPAAQAELDCSQFNHGLCSYVPGPVPGCCRPSPPRVGCPSFCEA